MNADYMSELGNLLLKHDEYVVEGAVNKNKVAEMAHKFDIGLINLLSANKSMRKLFFVETETSVLVFNKDKFVQFISNKQFLPESYTAYKNKIGLATDMDLLSEKKEVVLSWPYKDCILEGGQDKDDARREEVFYNEVLAPDQIDRLLDDKVLTGFTRYDKSGEHTISHILPEDNFIIRGNNLLGLHSLKKRFGGVVKLIFIDPPFNTGDDEFGYNDKFLHSTWLTFMRNRLIAAKELLAKDGVIAVCIGHEESDYVRVLMDEIFGRNNYLNHITNSTNDPSGFKATSSKIFSTANHTYLYANDVGSVSINKLYTQKKYDENYKFVLLNKESHYSEWKYDTIINQVAALSGFEDVKSYKIAKTKNQIATDVAKFAEDNRDIVFRTAAVSGGALQKRRETVNASKVTKGTVMKHPGDDVDDFYILNGEMIIFWGSLYRTVEGKVVPSQALTDIWTDIKWTGIASEGGVTLKNGKKPEKLLKRIIDLTTKPGDIVLDYHLGSGTTVAVAHKMGRRFVGIEQLDYGENDSVKRLRNVIDGDKTGISKLVGWNGGGSFVYARLMDLGNKFIERVKHASTDKELSQLLEQAKKSSFLSYRVDPEKINPGDKDFASLSIAHKKQLLYEIVDHNHLYVNHSEIEDNDYGVSSEDKKLNSQFYGK